MAETTLRGITWEHARGYDSIVAASDEYTRSHPDVRVKWDFRSLLDFGEAPLSSLTDAYDLVVVDHPHIASAAQAGIVQPLDAPGFDDQLAALSNQSVGQSHQSYSYGGRHYALAIDGAVQVSVCRPDLLPEPPTSWEGVLQLARSGSVLWAGKPIDAFSSLLSIAGSLGWTHAPSIHPLVPREVVAASLRILHSLADFVPPACLESNPIEIADVLSTDGRFTYSPLVFGYSNYSRAGFRPHLLSYGDVPKGPDGSRGSLLGGAGLAVSASSRFTREARDVAFWIASAPSQAGPYFHAGGQPANAAAWDDDAVDSIANGFFSATRATMEAAFVRPKYLGWIDFQDAAASLVARVLKRDIDDSLFLDEWERATDRLLAGEPHTLLGSQRGHDTE